VRSWLMAGPFYRNAAREGSPRLDDVLGS
jgi:hypothetical protein